MNKLKSISDNPIHTVEMSNAILIPDIVDLINHGHTVTLRLRGYSMRPFLENDRDKALLVKPPQTLKVGDPILAEVMPGRYVLHRIIKIDGNNLKLRGDGNLGVEQCTMKDIRCGVEGFYRKGRKTMDRVDGRKWKVYSFVWCHLFPIRRYLLAFYRRIWIPIFGVI